MPGKPPTLDVDESHVLASRELPSFVSRQVTEARRYYFDLNPEPSAALAVALGGWERVRADYAIHRPTFPYYSIEFVAEGAGRLVLAQQEYELAPGSVFAYGPGTPLEMYSSSRQLMAKYFVTFVGRQAAKLLRTTGFAANSYTKVRAWHEVREILDLMQSYGIAQTRFSQALCASLIPTLLYKIVEQSAPHHEIDPRSLATFQRLRELLDQEFLQLKNIEAAAGRCGVTVPYVCRLFKRFDHVTPYQYLLRRKMQFAADLLSDPQVLVKQVARRLEFVDQYQFSRAFKRIFGLSPTQFQRHLVPSEKQRTKATAD